MSATRDAKANSVTYRAAWSRVSLELLGLLLGPPLAADKDRNCVAD
jgi:hypothetical protein